MQAKETRLRHILEGQNQYVIPLFQRTYSWDAKEWQILWDDLVELLEGDHSRTHFVGSIVSMPTISVPEGVAKYLLIDGQQRVTTVFILLTLLRNKAKEVGEGRLADEIENTLLVNSYQDGEDYYKLMPTQVDRVAYKAILKGTHKDSDSQIQRAYDFFARKFSQKKPDIRRLKELIRTNLSLVSIVLDPDDNPHLVFESLNAKGRPLTQSDLIRNYFFMRVHVSQQEVIYSKYWQPMQTRLGDNLTEFIRHFLTRKGAVVKQSDVYQILKSEVSVTNALEYLEQLARYSEYYKKLLDPALEINSSIENYLRRLNRIEVTTAYPLLLNLYSDYENKHLSSGDFVQMLQVLENYLIRRFICGYATNQLNKIFPAIYQTLDKNPEGPVEGLKQVLHTKGYPKDAEVLLRLKDAKLYGAGDRLNKTRLILETLEDEFGHKEKVSFSNLTVEHIMPQTLTSWWQNHLGTEWQDTHELLLHTIGNLTLTAYNSELSNDSFIAKKERFAQSHLELNAYFENILGWNSEQIERRSEKLALTAIAIWPYFGRDETEQELGPVTGSTPTRLFILGEEFEVKSWRDVLEHTLNTIAFLEPEKFSIVVEELPHFISKNNAVLRSERQLNNGYFVEVNLSARRIERLCIQAIQTAELTIDDWKVTFVRGH
ncbi:DUF262 domain-containing protein [Spirosoma montaniterrae]|uniref:DUF262 domain-containing protein n=1 Tax=Spirosoma montaniterrae TaxID=1178516 RepID=A0A1P9WS48_9BACT|nr:DUF262 domain-containing protein [Spirosoma montaniterrae]AQG78170.1 hypothetical protein AWR27_01685 [Spirosoma montaniterrae]